MATAGNRRSKEIGHDMSNELGNLKHDIKSFKKLFEGKRTNLQARANYFKQKAAIIKRIQDNAATGRNVGAGFGVAGVAGIVLTIFTGGTPLLVAGAVMGAVSGAAITASNIVKMLLENNGQEKIKNGAEEFNKSIQPIVECLEKIQTNVQTLEELSSSTSTVTTGLSTAAEVTRLLKKVAELIIQVRRDEALEKELFDKIIKSAELCQKTINDFETLTEEFNKVSDFLQHF